MLKNAIMRKQMGGKVNIGTVQPPPVGLGLKIGSSTSVLPGQEICYPCYCHWIKSITAMQFFIWVGTHQN
jgi:hypothetical protein